MTNKKDTIILRQCIIDRYIIDGGKTEEIALKTLLCCDWKSDLRQNLCWLVKQGRQFYMWEVSCLINESVHKSLQRKAAFNLTFFIKFH